MRCPSCSFDNPEGMNFCGKCARPLAPRCPQCGFENPAGFAFCGKCATPLTPQSQQSGVQGLESSVQKASDFGPRTSDFGRRTPGLWTPSHLAEGYTAPEMEKAYTRALELCRQLGETPQLFLALERLWQFYLVRAEYQTAQELGEQLLSLAQSAQDPALFLAAHRALGEALFFLGELPPARAHLEQGIALYDPQRHHSLALFYGVDPGVFCLSFAAFALWCLGYPDQALNRIHEALARAQQLSHPPEAKRKPGLRDRDARQKQRGVERSLSPFSVLLTPGFRYAPSRLHTICW